MHLPLLKEIILLLSFSVVIVYFLQKLKLPSILGFIVTGILIGPYGFSLINAVEQVNLISEIGVIMLLFVIGMELSIKQLAAMKKTVFVGGGFQVAVTVLIAAIAYFLLGHSWNQSVFIGFLFSLSSTAIVLKILQDKGEITAPHGRNALAILIFQDIIVVPMMLFTPLLAGQSENLIMSVLVLLLKISAVALITYLSAKYIVPQFMHLIAKTRSKELFLLTTIAICFLVVFITDKAGLSVGLGARLAGLIISESEYNHQATSIILPFRELFTSFFFISIGMMLDLGFFVRHIGIIFIILLAVIIVKSFIAGVAVMILKYPARTIILTGLSLFQIGEFAFILSKVGIENHLLTEETKQYFLAVSIFSMLATPFIMMFSERIANWITGFKTVRRLSLKSAKRANTDMEARSERYENHLIIIGYGINGSNLAKAAQFSHIPYVVVELNAATVQREKEKGIPILYGDATQTHILNEVNVAGSRAVVIVISDSAATKTIIKNIRFISQSVYLLVRTRFVKDTQELLDMGADNVIPEEFETSIQIFSFVLQNFLVPEDDIEQFTHIIRDDNYDLFKNQKTRRKTFQPAQLPDFNITCMRINTDSGRFVGHPLKEMNLRANYGINILAVSRGENMIEQLDPNDVLQQDDIIYVNGKPENIEKFQRLIN